MIEFLLAAERLLAAGERDQAERLFEQVSEADPQNAMALFNRASLYPPVMLLLTAPFALIPYVPALFVWLSASWYAFYRALRLAMPGRGVLLLALASPAVLINAVGGQNGLWTAALLGGGLPFRCASRSAKLGRTSLNSSLRANSTATGGA